MTNNLNCDNEIMHGAAVVAQVGMVLILKKLGRGLSAQNNNSPPVEMVHKNDLNQEMYREDCC